MDYAKEKYQLLRICHRMYDKGWVANHDGNGSIRTAAGIITHPTALSKGELRQDQILIVSNNGHVLEGEGSVFSEFSTHSAIYAVRPDISAILHSHAPYSMALACAGERLDLSSFPEAIVSVGDNVPCIDYSTPGNAFTNTLISNEFLENHVAFVRGNGIFSVGDSIEMAFYRMELVEHLSKISLIMKQSQLSPLSIPNEDKLLLLEKRRKAHLAPPEVSHTTIESIQQKEINQLPLTHMVEKEITDVLTSILNDLD